MTFICPDKETIRADLPHLFLALITNELKIIITTKTNKFKIWDCSFHQLMKSVGFVMETTRNNLPSKSKILSYTMHKQKY